MAFPQPIGGLIQRGIDINTVTNPPSGSVYIGIDIDESLKLKHSDGSITDFGSTLTGTPSQVPYFDVSGNITGDDLFARDIQGQIFVSGMGIGTSQTFLVSGTSSITPAGSSLISANVNGGGSFMCSALDLQEVFGTSSIFSSGPGNILISGSDMGTQSTIVQDYKTIIMIPGISEGVFGIIARDFVYQSGNALFKFPSVDGTSGQAITTDGSGNLTFSTVGSGSGLTTSFMDGTYSINRGYSVDNILSTFYGTTMSGVFSTNSAAESFIGIIDASFIGGPDADRYQNTVYIGNQEYEGARSSISIAPFTISIQTMSASNTSNTSYINLADQYINLITNSATHSSRVYIDDSYVTIQSNVSGGTSSGFRAGWLDCGKPEWFIETNRFLLPSTHGSNGSVLSEDGLGNLYWSTWLNAVTGSASMGDINGIANKTTFLINDTVTPYIRACVDGDFNIVYPSNFHSVFRANPTNRSVTLGDVDSTDNRTKLTVDDVIAEIKSYTPYFTIRNVSSGNMWTRINTSSGVADVGDVGNNYNGTLLTVNDSLNYVNIKTGTFSMNNLAGINGSFIIPSVGTMTVTNGIITSIV